MLILLTTWEFPTFIWRSYQANRPCFRVGETEAQGQNNLFKCKHVEELWIRLKSPSSARWMPALLLLACRYFVDSPAMLPFVTAVQSSTFCEILTSNEQVRVRPSSTHSRCLWHLRAEKRCTFMTKLKPMIERKRLCNQSLSMLLLWLILLGPL